jgi:hypothetical protein
MRRRSIGESRPLPGKIYNSLIGVTTTVIRGARLVEMLCCLLRADDAICSRRLAIHFAILWMPGSPSGRSDARGMLHAADFDFAIAHSDDHGVS